MMHIGLPKIVPAEKRFFLPIFFVAIRYEVAFQPAATIVHHERSGLVIAALTGNPDGPFKYSKLSGLALT
jgi:hypothetical protein